LLRLFYRGKIYNFPVDISPYPVLPAILSQLLTVLRSSFKFVTTNNLLEPWERIKVFA